MLVAVLSILNAFFDLSKIQQGKAINHNIEAVVRGIIILIISLFQDKPILSFILNCSIFWIVFEITLNKLRELPILYVGYTSKIDKLARKIFPRNTGEYLLAVKLTILCATLYALIYW